MPRAAASVDSFTLRSSELDEMRQLPTNVAPSLPLHTRSSGPCSSPHPRRQFCSFILLPVSVAHREDRPLRGVKRGLSTSAGDAALSGGVSWTGRRTRPPHLCYGACLCARSQLDSALEIPWLGTPDDSGSLRTLLSTFRHAMVPQSRPYKPSRRRIVAKLPIA